MNIIFKKGQAAMDFLMTYGWAVLVVLAAIGSLIYFGALSPGSLEKCILPAEVASCLDFKYSGTGIEMVIRNNAGFGMDGITITVNGAGCNAVNTGGSATLSSGEQSTYLITCSPASGKFKGDVSFDYTNQLTGMGYSKRGEIILKIP